MSDIYSGWWSISFDGDQPDDTELERIGQLIANGYTSGDYYVEAEEEEEK